MNDLVTDLTAKRELGNKLLSGIRNLPPVPFLMLEVSKMLENPRIGASDLSKVISKDQAMVAKILTVANSPLYGLPRRVSTLEFAIVILGFDQIKNIIVAFSMMDAFRTIDERNWNKRAYWFHSIMTAVAAKRIADDLGYRRSGEAFTVGLLHDLGITVIHKYFNNKFHEIVALVESQKMSYLSAEEKVMKLSHQEIGKFLIEKWNLPDSIGDGILYHHTPSLAADNRELAAIVHLADCMTQRFLIGDFDWDENLMLDIGVINILNLGDLQYLENFIDSYKELFQAQFDSLIF